MGRQPLLSNDRYASREINKFQRVSRNLLVMAAICREWKYRKKKEKGGGDRFDSYLAAEYEAEQQRDRELGVTEKYHVQ